MKFIVEGGNKLGGEVTLAGAKNEASKLLIASLLTEDECVFKNVPHILEMNIVRDLCESFGSEIKVKGNEWQIKTTTIKCDESQMSQTRKNRIPILAFGPLLSRTNEAKIPFLGGDKLGARPVDLHIDSLCKMGAIIEAGDGYYYGRAPNGLIGAEINFHFPSVGATENILFAAVLAKGNTIIRNAAIEPEVIDIIQCLQKMGAIIELGVNRTIYIEGVERLRGVTHTVIPDRNEAASFASLALAAQAEIFIKQARQEDLITFLNIVRRLGGEYEVMDDGILFKGRPNLRPINLQTSTHPGLMTDWQQPLAVVLTQANGESIIHETIYDNRFAYVKDLINMGANIELTADCLGENCRFKNNGYIHSAKIFGKTALHGSNLLVHDLRSGIAHLIAASIATGVSEINGIEEIDRGYENIDERLSSLGLKIKREV